MKGLSTAHMRVEHVEMALVDGHVGRLADRAARMVQPFRHVAQLHERLEIGHRGIAPPAIEVAHRRAGRRPARGRGNCRRSRRRGRVARDLGEFRRRGFAQLAGKAAGDAHALAFDIGAGLAPAVQRGGVLDEPDADLFQHRFGVVLDDLERLFVQDLEVRDVALDERAVSKRTAERSARRAAPPPPRARRPARSASPMTSPSVFPDASCEMGDIPPPAATKGGLRRLRGESDMSPA
jgi:hypothetical protein